jgi:prepilin-type N-terminal cleavage/methylation domain-containing protein
MRPPPLPPAPTGIASQKGFTLVELVVAMAIVLILMATMIGLLSSTSMITLQSRKQIDADSEARMIFDRMKSDFDGMVKRPDVDYIFARPTGNDALFFYSEAPALADGASAYSNTCALVGYRINSSNQLERLGKGLTWGAAPPDGPVFLAYASTTAPLSPDSNSTFANSAWSALVGTAPAYNNGTSSIYYHVLGDSVFRLEICFLLKPLKQTDGSVLPAIYSNLPYDIRPNQLISPVPSSLYGLGSSEIQAIVVTMAILDLNSRKIVSAANLQALAGDFLDPTDTELASTPPKLMAQTWSAALVNTTFTGVMKQAASNVHIYQRVFYLGPFLN